MQRLLEESFGGWQAPPGPAPALPTPPLPDQSAHAGRIFLVDRPGATQARPRQRSLGAAGGCRGLSS